VLALDEPAPVVLLAPLDELVPLDELALGETDPPQTLVFGTQARIGAPSAPWSDVHVRPCGHDAAEQSGAQYWSPANCAHLDPAAQSAVWRQGAQAAGAAPVPPLDDVRPPVVPPCPVGPVVVWPPAESIVLDWSPPAAHAANARRGAPSSANARTDFMASRALQRGHQVAAMVVISARREQRPIAHDPSRIAREHHWLFCPSQVAPMGRAAPP
jgi:hypothetical protein